MTKEKVYLLKSEPTEWKETFISYISDRGLISRLDKKTKTSQKSGNNHKKPNSLINRLMKWTVLKRLTTNSINIKKCSASVDISGMQIKISATLRFNFYPSENDSPCEKKSLSRTRPELCLVEQASVHFESCWFPPGYVCHCCIFRTNMPGWSLL